VRILILGGGVFVGRALVDAALDRGHLVTTFTRTTRPAAAGDLDARHGDRTTPLGLAALRDREWDVVFDTWSGAPRVVRDSVALLRESAAYYSYVSTCSVYREPIAAGSNEDSPVVEASSDAEASDYPADKRGAELAVLEGFGAEHALLARAGLILGPYEGPGRLVWWLNRIAAGGEVLAPGPADLPLQFIDARDLAAWMLDCAETATAGVFNAISAPGHTTMGPLLTTCNSVTDGGARFTWVTPEFVAERRIEPWTELPLWVPPGEIHDSVYRIDTSRAAAAGLVCRPMEDTVADTWSWIRGGGTPRIPSGRTPPGLDPAREAAALEAWVG
jgi:2'-hydroxyisoflavone reductase